MKLNRSRKTFLFATLVSFLAAAHSQSCSGSTKVSESSEPEQPDASSGESTATGGGSAVSGGLGAAAAPTTTDEANALGGGIPAGDAGRGPSAAGSSPGSGATSGTTTVDASLSAPNPSETTVAIVQSTESNVSDLDQNDVRTLVQEAVQLAGGLGTVVSAGDVVVLKPNLVAINESTLRGAPLAVEGNGVTTDWRVAAAVVELVREHNPGAVYIMEGSVEAPTDQTMAALGYTAANFTGPSAVDQFIAIESDSGGWQQTDAAGLIQVPVADGLLGDQYYYNRRYYEADVVISLPTLKSHWHAIVTGAVKNLAIGATPANIYGATARSLYRGDLLTGIDHESIALHHWIHDYYLGRPAQFVVMDGLQGIQNGPNPSYDISEATDLAQDQMNMRLIMAGRDAIAVDAIQSLIMQWDPQGVEYLSALEQSGAGTINPANIRVVGSRVDQVKKSFACPADTQSHGEPVPVTDTTPPPLTVQGHSALPGLLLINVAADADLSKLEVYVGNTLVEPPVTSQFEQIALDTSGLGPGTYDLLLLGYDAYLNVTEHTIPDAVVVQ